MMLPRQLYELLPFIYIFTGILCAVLIDSTIVLISSMLLIVTGIFVLLMRRNFRKALNKRYELYQQTCEPDVAGTVEKRSGFERRQRKVTRWPTQDKAGEKVISDRRAGERRMSAIQSEAY